ncbi:unnamed protein product [Blepharisma stoltei]|uniref:Uncharacterized protein n=1 Tax=Blepharisma stoltei TaxID=1481888 RepID=A0AAU9JCN7_9CILI|nr:unnamed protein product [Blepharisma stoltei]
MSFFLQIALLKFELYAIINIKEMMKVLLKKKQKSLKTREKEDEMNQKTKKLNKLEKILQLMYVILK